MNARLALSGVLLIKQQIFMTSQGLDEQGSEQGRGSRLQGQGQGLTSLTKLLKLILYNVH